MKCRNCGFKNSITAKYCEKCGEPLKIKKGKNNKNELILLGIVVVVACVIISCLTIPKFFSTKQYNDVMKNGETFLKKMDYKQAEDYYLKAINIDPKQSKPYILLANVYMSQNKKDKAVKLLKEASKAVTKEEKAEIIQKQKELENYKKYQWVVEPSIEADDIFYATSREAISYINDKRKQDTWPVAVLKLKDKFHIINIEGDICTKVAYKEIHSLGYSTMNDSVYYVGEFDKEYYAVNGSNDYKVSQGGVDINGNVYDGDEGDIHVAKLFYYSNDIVTINDDSDSDRNLKHLKVMPIQEVKDIPNSNDYTGEEYTKWIKKQNGKFALCDGKKLITDFIYEDMGSYSDGLIAVKKEGKWGYINENGEEIIPCEYDDSWNYFTGKYNFNDYGNDLDFTDFAYGASDGYVNLKHGDTWLLVDTKGNTVIPEYTFEKILPVYEDKCFVLKDGKWGIIQLTDYDLSSKQAVSVTFKANIIEENEGFMQSAIIKGLDEKNNVIWTYKTKEYACTELDRVNEIGIKNNKYYFVEDRVVTTLNLSDGSVLWKNEDFGGSSSAYTFDEKGTLYLCGYYGPHLFIVDKNGKTMHKVDSFENDYMWPSKIKYESNKITITFDNSPSGNEADCIVDLKDYSYHFKNNDTLSTEQLNKIKKELNVPDDLNVTFEQNGPYYFEAGDTWYIQVNILYNGEKIAGADVYASNGELLRGMMTYSDE